MVEVEAPVDHKFVYVYEAPNGEVDGTIQLGLLYKVPLFPLPVASLIIEPVVSSIL